jgi:ubiquitin-like 1-activating enzyme E1 B
VARQAAHAFNPGVKLEAHHANIKDSQFNIAWFKGFTMVFNALDNLEARRHVNKMCLAADIPLIESGTTGFNGQVQVIKKGVTACYDCTPKETPKSFPVCTIRSTPSQPIHCIVWGKSYLLRSEDLISILYTNADRLIVRFLVQVRVKHRSTTQKIPKTVGKRCAS